MNLNQAAPDAGGMIRILLTVLVGLFAGWLLLAWMVVKRPILALPVIAFTALVLLVGMHDAQALAIYLLGALWIWRPAHRASFERMIGRRLRNSWVRWWVYERRWRATMRLSGLGKRGWPREAVPKIAKVN